MSRKMQNAISTRPEPKRRACCSYKGYDTFFLLPCAAQVGLPFPPDLPPGAPKWFARGAVVVGDHFRMERGTSCSCTSFQPFICFVELLCYCDNNHSRPVSTGKSRYSCSDVVFRQEFLGSIVTNGCVLVVLFKFSCTS